MDLSARHPSTRHLLSLFDSDHLPPRLAAVATPCRELAYAMAEKFPDGPELSFGLRELLLAKDAFVRCAVADSESMAN